MTPAEYLASIRERLIADPLVTSFAIRRERSTPSDGHMRAALTFGDGSGLEFSEYFQATKTGQVVTVTYSYHWSDAEGRLIFRWDNTPHFPGLPGFPHHVHDGGAGEVLPAPPRSIFEVLEEIGRTQAR
jgi:hypothetical protein